MRPTLKYLWSIAIGVAIVATGVVSFYRPPTSLPTDYTLPKDNFDTATMSQIQRDVRQYHTKRTPQNHEVYMVTGGIGVANPRVLGWGPGGNMVFGFNSPNSDTFQIQELGQNPMMWRPAMAKGKRDSKSTKDSIRWFKKRTATGGVYYSLSEAGAGPEYVFRKGDTYVLVMAFPKPIFPSGLMSHLVLVGNPVKR